MKTRFICTIRGEPLVLVLVGMRFNLLHCLNTWGSLPFTQCEHVASGDDNDFRVPRSDEEPRIAPVLQQALDTV